MELTSERIDRVFAAKVDAAFHLHTDGIALIWMHLFYRRSRVY